MKNWKTFGSSRSQKHALDEIRRLSPVSFHLMEMCSLPPSAPHPGGQRLDLISLSWRGPLRACSFGMLDCLSDAVNSSPACDAGVHRVASSLVLINHSNPETHPLGQRGQKFPVKTKKWNHKRPAYATASSQTLALHKTANDPGHKNLRLHFIAYSLNPQNKLSRNQPLRHLTRNKIITHSGQQAARVKWKNVFEGRS